MMPRSFFWLLFATFSLFGIIILISLVALIFPLVILNQDLLFLLMIIICLALIIALALAIYYRRPLQKISQALALVGKENQQARLIFSGDSALEPLARHFNTLIDRLEWQQQKNHHRLEEARSIIAALEEGLLVLSRNGVVLQSNPALKRFVGQQELEGKRYWEIIREKTFADLIEKTIETREPVSGELDLLKRIFLISVGYMPKRERVVVLLHDITDIRHFEQVKKDFVANVSHELRTPLTAIKGFVETLREEQLAKNHQRYLEIIQRHTERMINMVADLMLLAELEHKHPLARAERVDLGAAVRDVSAMFEQKVNKKSLRLILNLPEQAVFIAADLFQLEQLLVNLIDNACKYTEQGTILVAVEVDAGLKHAEAGLKPASTIRLVIKDTGSGIPAEQLPRVFERFYVTDKSRSRRLGGTGLGLSIVKNIVHRHGWLIDVASTMGEGTTFTVSVIA